MRSIILFSLLLSGLACSSQNNTFAATKKNLEKPKAFGKGSLINVQYDSVLVYDNTRHKESLAAFNNLLKQFALVRQQYDSCQGYASGGATKLSAVTSSLAASVKQTADSAGVTLLKTKQNLDLAVSSLTAATANLKAVEELLQREKRENRRRAVAWGVGGFGLGILTSSFVLLMNHR